MFIKDINISESKSIGWVLDDTLEMVVSEMNTNTYSYLNYSIVGYTELPIANQPINISIGGVSRFTLLPLDTEATFTPEQLVRVCEDHFVSGVLRLTDVQPVPSSVTRRQARQQLLILGLLDQVVTQIDAIEDPLQRELVRIFWEDSNEFERDNVQLNLLATSLGMTQEDLDNAFIAAKLL